MLTNVFFVILATSLFIYQIAFLIMGNFIANVAETALMDEKHARIFNFIDFMFTIVWTLELMVNMFATLVVEFVQDSWNWFDVLIVSTSLIGTVTDLPGGDLLRLMRCFRVIRLLKRIPSLRKISISLVKSLVPVGNAFALVMLLSSIYAIIATTFFASSRKVSPDRRILTALLDTVMPDFYYAMP